MTIFMSCECGRTINAPDAARGKRGKCPSCGRTLFVPAGADAPPPTVAPIPTRPCSRCGGVFPASRAPSLRGVPVCERCLESERQQRQTRRTKKFAMFAGGGLVIAVSAVLLVRGNALEPKSSEVVVAESEGSVALLKGWRGHGSGFLVRERLLVTNAHVVQLMFADELTAQFGEDTVPVKSVRYFDAARDLCIVEIGGNRRTLTIADDASIEKGEEVLIIGSPGIGEGRVVANAVSKGTLGPYTEIDGKSYVEISASVNPGNSGGPVLDAYGHVVGVLVSRATRQEGIAFCIPARDLRAALEASAKGDGADVLHSARTAFLRLWSAGSGGLDIMESLIGGMDRAIKMGSDVSIGLAVAKETQRDSIKGLASILGKSLEPQLRRLQHESGLGEDAKKNLLNLWAKVQEIQSYVVEPRGSFLTYSQKSRESKDELDRLCNLLRIQLDVSERISTELK